ncbi:MAG: peptidylprolyl isomerase [Planctomycetaceae bacterium]|nr:peptidylprolyl isomerase [Planctomycetaceae bacterium]
MPKSIFTFTLLLVFSLGTLAFSQESEAPASPPQGPTQADLQEMSRLTAEEAAKLGPANAEFHLAYKDWLERLKELRALKLEYQQAKPDRMIEIEKQYNEKVAVGTKKQPELTVLAFKAFEETPYKNPYVFMHIFSLIEWESGRENYEKVVEYFQKMETYGIPETSRLLYVVAGLSALKSMQYELADKWLAFAQNEKIPGMEKTYLQFYLEQTDDKTRANMAMLSMMQMTWESWEKELEIRKKEEAETDPAKQNPQVLLKTNKGDIVLELFEDDAPNTVASFISLVNKGFYKNVVFHRVLPSFMAQGGDPKGTGTGGPGYMFDCECYKPDYRRHFRGSISMANAGPHTNGSQFFLTFVPTSFLDGKHTVFGRIVDGMEVLSDITRIDPEKENQPEPDKILEAKVLRCRPHEYVPKVNRRQ